MSNRIVAYVAIFNAIVIAAFIFSNIYVWDYLNTEINLKTTHQPNGGAIVPSIGINGFQITVSHAGWTEDGQLHSMPLPISVPNYPFIVFWVAIVGNLALIALLFRKLQQNKEKPIG